MLLADHARIGISIPQIFPGGKIDMPLIRKFVGRAEELRFHSLWTQEQLLGQSPILEPISLLNYVASLTSVAKLGVSVMVLSMRHPIQLAKGLSSLDQMSEGRLIVGLGMATPRHNKAITPVQDRRVGRFLEWFRIVKGLWTESSFNLQGNFWQLDDARMEPKPHQLPYPPVWFGGAHPDALERAVRHANGWMGAGSSSIEDFLECVPMIKRSLDGINRDHKTFTISKRIYIAVDADKVRAERRMRDWFEGHYRNPELAARVGVAGSAEYCASRIAEVVEEGAGHVLLNPVFDHMLQMEALADLVGLRS